MMISDGLLTPGIISPEWSHHKWTALFANVNTPRTHWDPVTQTIFSALRSIWPHSFSSAYTNEFQVTLMGPPLNWHPLKQQEKAISFLLYKYSSLYIFLFYFVHCSILLYLCRYCICLLCTLRRFVTNFIVYCVHWQSHFISFYNTIWFLVGSLWCKLNLGI